MKFIKMYSADWCFDCKAMVTLFEENNVAYKLFNVDNDPQAIDKLKDLCSGKKIVPTLEIEGQIYVNPTIDSVTKLIQ